MSLGRVPGSGGSHSSFAGDFSANGSVIAGRSVTQAFRWTDRSGMRSIQELLAEPDVDTTGWMLNLASGISPMAV
jgi:hypothetical protein